MLERWAAASSSRCIRVSPTVGVMPWQSFCFETQAWSWWLVTNTCASLSILWPRWSEGERRAFTSSGSNCKNLEHNSSSKLLSSSPTPLRPCFVMNAGSQLRSESYKARTTMARCNVLARAASSRDWRAQAAFCSFRSLRLNSGSKSSSAALFAARASASSQGGRLGMTSLEGVLG